MATIDNKSMIDELITNDGFFEDDPRVYQIVEYINAFGRIAWGVTWSYEPELSLRRYEIESEYVNSPRVIWRAK